MGDVLSQSEIDNLLAALSSGDVTVDDIQEKNEKQAKNYDFARPSKFSKEHLRTLEIIFEHYARLLSTHLPAYLRKNVQVDVMTSEAITYSEFSNALSNPVLLGVVNFAPLEGSIVMEISNKLGYAIVDRMLGGAGIPLEKKRDFTEIELIILERVINTCTNLMIEPWQAVANISPRLERIETNNQFAQFISPSEMVALITMNIRIGTVEGRMNICIPYVCVESVIDKLNTKYWYSTMKEEHDRDIYQGAIESIISKAKIPVRAILGKSIISVNDFVNIQPGDIIRLDTKIDEELNVYVGNINKFTALPGASSDVYAVRITSVIREEQ